MRTICFLLVIALLSITKAYSQFSDSLAITIGTTVTVAAKHYQPLWIVSNQYNTLTNQKADLSTHFRISNNYIFRSKPQVGSRKLKGENFYINYGFDIYSNNHFRDVFMEEAFIETGYKSWMLRGGRFEEIIGEVDPALSSGSFGISGNALPIPKIAIAVSQYKEVPYTKGWLQFKGRFSHGWLGKTNSAKGAFLHEKYFYLKVGKNYLNFYGGLNHFAQWGGIHPSGKAPSRFKDYLRIVVGASGNASDPVYQQGPIDFANAVGNHLIIPDFGITFKNRKSVFKLYTQTIFEKGVADSANQRDKLSGLKLVSRDRLIGLSWEIHKKKFIEKLVLEGIYTKYQGGPIIFRGRDNYYNNATYQTGWEYHNFILGTPLFINRHNAGNYNLNTDINVLSGWNIVSNRVKGIHLGLKGHINKKLSYRILATCIRHYGNYYNNIVFTPFKSQIHLLSASSYQLNRSITLTSAIGLDCGDLSNNIGGIVKVEWNLR